MKCKFCGKERFMIYEGRDMYFEECNCVGEIASRIFNLRLLAYELEVELMDKLEVNI